MVEITSEQWIAELKRRYPDPKQAKFVCPSCGYVQTWGDFAALGMGKEVIPSMLAYSCIGRYREGEPQEAFTGRPGPCNYAGGGLFRIARVRLLIRDQVKNETRAWECFDFADEPLAAEAATSA